MKKLPPNIEHCAICGCLLNRNGNYADPTPQGRAHASEHHLVAERFFGSRKKKEAIALRLFQESPWKRESDVFCYDCHEILLHNPVFTRENISQFAELVRQRELDEPEKTESCEKLAGRVRLFHEVIETGLKTLAQKSDANRKS